MAESSSGPGLTEDLFAEAVMDTTGFAGFPTDSPVIGRPTKIKKPRLHGHAKPVLSPTSSEPASNNTTQFETLPASHSSTTFLLLREDKKALPFNFYAQISKSWPALQFIKPDSLSRNLKGTIITGEVLANKVNQFTNSDHYHENNGIKYKIRIPREPPMFQGEVIFDFTDIEDKYLLSYTAEDLLAELTLPVNQNANKILSVKKLFPSHVVADPNNSSFQAMRIAIECSSAVPDKVFYHNVSLQVHSYLAPPPRCYGCQRFGHGSISCRRRAVCARCSSPDHVVQNCNADNPCCASCKGPHPASSPRCPLYQKAMAISSRVASRVLSREMAAKEYAALYLPTEAQPSQPSLRNTMQTSEIPGTSVIPQPKLPENRAPNSMHHTNSPWPASYASSALTPGQPSPSFEAPPRKRKNPGSPTPPHMTEEYQRILRGDLWSDATDLPPLPQLSQNFTASPATNQPEKPITKSSLVDLLANFFKSLFVRCLHSLSEYLSASDSPLSAMFQPLLASLISQLSSS
jgi:hypothetical protein